MEITQLVSGEAGLRLSKCHLRTRRHREVGKKEREAAIIEDGGEHWRETEYVPDAKITWGDGKK